MSGKGSKRRPSFVSQKEFAKNWNRIFVRKRNVKSKHK
jgi:hypothetical protein